MDVYFQTPPAQADLTLVTRRSGARAGRLATLAPPAWKPARK